MRLMVVRETPNSLANDVTVLEVSREWAFLTFRMNASVTFPSLPSPLLRLYVSVLVVRSRTASLWDCRTDR